MKKIFKIFIITFIISSSTILLAQPPDPDPDPGTGGGGSLGGSAPVGSGLVILFILGLAYGGKKFYTIGKKDNEIHKI